MGIFGLEVAPVLEFSYSYCSQAPFALSLSKGRMG